MIWQEWAILAIQASFVPGLWDTVRGPKKPAHRSAVITSLGLWALVVVFLTMPQYVSALGASLPATMFSILAWQTRRPYGMIDSMFGTLIGVGATIALSLWALGLGLVIWEVVT